MRILIFNELYVPYQKGGAEVSTRLLAETLVKLGHEIHVCTSANKNYDELINGVAVHRRKQNNVYWSYNNDRVSIWKKTIWHLVETYNVFEISVIKDMISLVKPDIIHTNVFTGFSILIWKIAKQRNIPIVHTLRDFYLMCLRSTLFNRGQNCKQCTLCKILSFPKKMMSKDVDAVVGISHFILNKHIHASYFEKAEVKKVIPNAISMYSSIHKLERFHIIGYLGRIHKSKGIEYLIESFLNIGDTDYELHIGGNGSQVYVDELKRKYSSQRIHFLGRVDSEDFLSKIDLLVVPSIWEEPFGRVVIEANACGCPVLVSNRGGLPELINGENGAVFNLDIDNSLTYLLEKFIQGKIHFENTCSKTIELYSKEFIACEYEKIYNELNKMNKDK